MNEMGPAPEGGIYHKPGTEDFTNNRRHESQTGTYAASRFMETKESFFVKYEKKNQQRFNLFLAKIETFAAKIETL